MVEISGWNQRQALAAPFILPYPKTEKIANTTKGKET